MYTMQMLYKTYTYIRWGQQSCIQWVTIQRTMQMSAEIWNWREGGEGQLTVACFLYFMQFNLYTPTGCLHRKPNNMHI